MPYAEIVEADGHLVDSQILSKIFDRVIGCGAEFEVIAFNLGRTNEDFSHLRLRVVAPDQEALDKTLEELLELGCYQAEIADAVLRPAPADRVVPDDFYSTTNHRTFVRRGGVWLEVSRQRMDAVVVVADGQVECRKLRDVRRGELVICGAHGIRIQPEFKERDRLGFAFMANDISSERRAETAVVKIAELMRQIKAEGGRIIFVAGPVVIHTGGTAAFCEIIRKGYVDALLAGNAIAVHDVEHALYGTSLGVDLEKGIPIEEGHKNHMRAINTINRHGSIRARSRRECSARASWPNASAAGSPSSSPARSATTARCPTPRWTSSAPRRRTRVCSSTPAWSSASPPCSTRSASATCSLVGPHGLRRHQPGGRHQALRPRLATDGRRRHRRRHVPQFTGPASVGLK